jgi:hypothetical protein
MATNENKTTKAAEKAKDNRVEIFVPKGYANDDPNFHIGINGVNYVLPRGKKSLVPDFVAAEFYRSQRAQEKLDETMEQMLEASK